MTEQTTEVSNNKLEVRRNAVIHAARRLSDCADEFEGDMSVCGEYLDALWCAVDCLKAEESDHAS